jgi:hypothetical protein
MFKACFRENFAWFKGFFYQGGFKQGLTYIGSLFKKF